MDATPDTGPTILYVDDEQQACKWFARMVSASYNVLTANSVEEAKAVLRDMHDRIGVVLTDFRMPGGDGTELLRFIDAEYSDIAAILVTAYADKDLLSTPGVSSRSWRSPTSRRTCGARCRKPWHCARTACCARSASWPLTRRWRFSPTS